MISFWMDGRKTNLSPDELDALRRHIDVNDGLIIIDDPEAEEQLVRLISAMPDEILDLLDEQVFLFVFREFLLDGKNIVAGVSMTAFELQTGETVALIGLTDYVLHCPEQFPYIFLHELSHFMTANLITDGELHNSEFQNYLHCTKELQHFRRREIKEWYRTYFLQTFADNAVYSSISLAITSVI